MLENASLILGPGQLLEETMVIRDHSLAEQGTGLCPDLSIPTSRRIFSGEDLIGVIERRKADHDPFLVRQVPLAEAQLEALLASLTLEDGHGFFLQRRM